MYFFKRRVQQGSKNSNRPPKQRLGKLIERVSAGNPKKHSIELTQIIDNRDR
jgi:hypothetical protein